jgi:hypothetical protein
LRKNAVIFTHNLLINNSYDELEKQLKETFDHENLERLAREHNFIKRSGKLSADMFASSLVFSDFDQSRISLLDLKCDFLSDYECDVSRVAIHKRFTPEAVAFMKALFAKLLSSRLEETRFPFLSKAFFSRVCIKDSTKFRLPSEFIGSYPGYGSFNKKSSLMNIQYEYDLQSGDWLSLELTKATRNDQEDSKDSTGSIEKGNLYIRDLGYVTLTYLKAVADADAYFINRMPTNLNVYQGMKKVDWGKIDRKMKQRGNLCYSFDATIGKKEQFKVRMAIEPVPEEVYKERIKKASQHAKSKSCQLSKEYKTKAKYNIYITNVPVDIISPEDIAKVYGLRWQIELVFKKWKSNLSINKVKKVKKERFECQLIAKLIWILLAWKIFQVANMSVKQSKPTIGCSMVKFFKQLVKANYKIKEIIIKQKSLINWLKEFICPIIPDMIIEPKKGKKSYPQVFADKMLRLS